MAEVKITVTAKDGSTQTFKAIEEGAKSAFSSIENSAKSSSSRTTSAFEGIKSSWIAITGAITAAVAAVITVITKLVEQATLAARVETLSTVIGVVGRNAGYSSAQVEGYVQGVKKMGITTQESILSITRMIQAQMDLRKSDQLARVAQDAAVIGNVNSSQALATLMQGIQSAEVETLRQIGINVNFEQSYEKLAQKLGKSTEALTEQEKIQARTNVVLEAGKNIAGVYAASMDTVGKQASSLSRHYEEAKLKLGELFKPAYAALVTIAADALGALNAKLVELKNSGDLARWGEMVASVFSNLGQVIPVAISGLLSLGATVATLISKFQALKAISTGVLSGVTVGGGIGAAFMGGNALGQWMEENSPKAYKALGTATKFLFPGAASLIDWAASRAENDRTWEKAFNEQMAGDKETISKHWKKTQKAMEESGIKGIQTAGQLQKAKDAGQIVEYTVKVGVDPVTGLDTFETRFKDVRNVLQATKEQIDATTKGFSQMSTVIDQMGGMSLKTGSSDLSRIVSQNVLDMRALSVEYQKLSDATHVSYELDNQVIRLNTITRAYKDYGDTIDDVYSNQVSLQKEILYEMGLYETKQSNIAKQAANVAETEIKYNEAKLQNYRAYYDELKKAQKSFYDQAVTAAKNMASIEKSLIADRKTGADMLYSMWDKANPAANELEAYNRKVQKIYQDMAYAATLSGEDQVKAFQDIRQAAQGLAGTITVSDTVRKLVEANSTGLNTGASYQDTVISRIVDTTPEAMTMVAGLTDHIAQLKQAMWEEQASNQEKALSALASVTDSINLVEVAMKAVGTQLETLNTELMKQRTLSIDTSGAMSSLRIVQDQMLEMLRLKAELEGKTSSSSSYEFTFDTIPINGSSASSASSVSRSGLARSEGVTSGKTASTGRAVTINFGDIVISGSGKDARQIARELAPAIKEELKKIEARS